MGPGPQRRVTRHGRSAVDPAPARQERTIAPTWLSAGGWLASLDATEDDTTGTLGDYVDVEVKFSASERSVDAAAADLLRLRDKVAPRRVGDLASLLVVTPVGSAYRRSDGVKVAPITTLGP